MTRRLLAFMLVLGLAPGVTGGLVEGAAHCSHACCQGQNFCHRGTGGHDHDGGHDMAVHHGDHQPASGLALTAIEPPSESCLETCGVLRDARPGTEGATRIELVGAVHQERPEPTPFVLAADAGSLVDPASPRGPPR